MEQIITGDLMTIALVKYVNLAEERLAYKSLQRMIFRRKKLIKVCRGFLS